MKKLQALIDKEGEDYDFMDRRNVLITLASKWEVHARIAEFVSLSPSTLSLVISGHENRCEKRPRYKLLFEICEKQIETRIEKIGKATLGMSPGFIDYALSAEAEKR